MPLAKASVVLNATDFIGFNISASEIARIVSGGLIVSGGWVNSTNAAFNQICLSGNCKTSWPANLVGGSGTANYIPIWTASDTLGNSILYQSGGNVGIGTMNPNEKLTVVGGIGLRDGSLWQPIYPSDDYLVGYWPFSEGIGSKTYDKSPYGNDGTIYAGDWTDGKYGKALSFNGIDGCVAIPSTFPKLGGNKTILAWVNRNPNSRATIFTVDDADWGWRGYAFKIESDGRMTFRVGNGITAEQKTGSLVVPPNIYSFVVAVYENSSNSVTFFLNGIKDGPYYFSLQNTWNISQFGPTIGGEDCVGNEVGLNGTIDEVRVYNKALSEEEIRAHYLQGLQSHGYIMADYFKIINTSAQELLRVTPTGNVGIGTTAPTVKLDVAGTIRAQDVFAAGGQNLIIGDDVFLTDIDTANTLGIYGLQDSTRAHIKLGSNGPVISGVNGNVGIGTTNPAYKLDVNGGNPLRLTGANGGTLTVDSWGITDWRYAGTQFAFLYWHSMNDVYFDLFKGGVSTIRLRTGGDSYLNGGNVGIGTTNPAYKLDVNGGNPLRLTGANGGTLTVDSWGITDWRYAGTQFAFLYWHSMNDVYFDLFKGGVSTIRLRTGGDSYLNGGNVGIGTTTPGAKLHVVGTGKFETGAGTWNWIEINRGGDTIYFGSDESNRGIWSSGTRDVGIYTNGVARILVKGDTGNVGIGTTTPRTKLHVTGSWPTILIETTDLTYSALGHAAGKSGFGFLTNTGAAANVNVGGLAITSSYFVTPPTNGLYVQGNVGIGTTTPGAKLHVFDVSNGEFRLEGVNKARFLAYSGGDLWIQSGSAWTSGSTAPIRFSGMFGTPVHMTIDSTGNVGIGTTTPSSKLEVYNGDIEINDGQATGTYKIKGLRVFYAGDETQVSTTSTTPELKKQFTSVFDSTYGIKPSYVNVIARIWNGASGRTTYLNVTLEGCNGIILSATSTSATVVKGSISVATCPDGLYSAKVYLYTTSGGTAYNDLIEFYYVG